MGGAYRLDQAKVRALIVAIWLLGASPTMAQFKGADFLDASTEFGKGYAFATAETITGLLNESFAEGRQSAISTCLLQGGLTSNEIYDAVRRYIEANPPSLVEPAFVAVLKTLNAICP